jgi:S1-C subfamily serine protease
MHSLCNLSDGRWIVDETGEETFEPGAHRGTESPPTPSDWRPAGPLPGSPAVSQAPAPDERQADATELTDRDRADPSTATTEMPGYPPPLGFPAGAPPRPEEQRRGHGRAREWGTVALVAAVVGGGVGAGIAEAVGTGSTSAPSGVIRVGEATPGPALAGGASIPTIVKAVLPEVVSIDAKGPAQGGFGGVSEDQGTGIVISTSGEVLTNNHVISGATTITVTLYNQTSPLKATLVGADASNDLALLKIDSPPSNLQPVTFGDSTHLQVGDAVIAIGNALGLSAGTPTVTSGIVSALGRTVQAGDATGSSESLSNLIQTDAAINSGNSGGPLVDSAGQVVGINTAVASSSSGNAPAQNIGFAIPSSTVQKLIPELRNGGTSGASKAYLGVYVTDETAALQQQYGLVPSAGALVESVVSGSPAESAGVQPGDVIVQFGSKPVASAQDLTNAVAKDQPGQSVSIVLWRGQQKLTLSVSLTSAPAG